MAMKPDLDRYLMQPLETWHSVAGVRRWSAKMESSRPQFNFMPLHAFPTEIPEDLRRQSAEAVSRALTDGRWGIPRLHGDLN